MAGLIQLAPFEDANRKLLTNTAIPFYLPGTSTLAALFSDAAGTTPTPNPVTTDDFGNLPAVYADPGLYEYEVRGLRLLVEVPGGGSGTHPSLADHDTLGLTTQAELDAHAADASHTNARTPTAHAASHANAGSDPVTPTAIGAATEGHTHPAQAAYTTVQDEGVALTQRAVLDIKGPNVAATDDATNAKTVVTVSDPVPAHEAAADPHPGYRLESAPIGTTDLADGSVTAAKVAADVATQAELDAEKVLRTHVTLWAAVGYVATNAPAGGVEPTAGIGGSDWVGRARMDARRATHFRTWHVLTAAVAANGVRFEYSTDVGATWNTLLDAGAGNAVGRSPWTELPAAAQVEDLTIRVMVYGDGVADPSLRRAEVEFGTP